MKPEQEMLIEHLLMIAELTEDQEVRRPTGAFYMFNESDTVKAPNWMANNAKRGLKLREKAPKSQKCCTASGLQRANQLAKQENLSKSTIKRMKSFASRHGGQLTKEDESGKTKRGQSMLIWGCRPTKSGVDRFVKWCDAQLNKMEKK